MIPLLVLLVIGMDVAEVSAWAGSDSAPYAAADEDQPGNFAVVDATSSNGECEIKVDALPWPYYYWAGTWSAAWVAGSMEMSETWTPTWYMSASWDIDYRLQTAYNAKVTIYVVFRLYSSDFVKLEEHVAWWDDFTSWEWDDVEAEFSDSEVEAFTYNLLNGYTYYFAVGLKVYMNYNQRDVRVTASSDHSDPALLDVNGIIWTSSSPE
ncbi:MAG: hypothetical protein JSW61_13745 [Candidatus Thorarchaeota archaeon]|nr:MAG: hypothetical protein JSW61_13745 [Candidatus Thorarchaeota archaeon]